VDSEHRHPANDPRNSLRSHEAALEQNVFLEIAGLASVIFAMVLLRGEVF
jgi:hypothetical protein